MHTVNLTATTRGDGTVLLVVPTGAPTGETIELQVRVSRRRRSFASKRSWQNWVKKMAGSIVDSSFDRPEQPAIGPIAAIEEAP